MKPCCSRPFGSYFFRRKSAPFLCAKQSRTFPSEQRAQHEHVVNAPDISRCLIPNLKGTEMGNLSVSFSFVDFLLHDFQSSYYKVYGQA